MKLSELKPCCSSPARKVQETKLESSSPLVAPLWLRRVVCGNCGKATPWVDSLDKACELWQRKEA